MMMVSFFQLGKSVTALRNSTAGVKCFKPEEVKASSRSAEMKMKGSLSIFQLKLLQNSSLDLENPLVITIQRKKPTIFQI